MGLGICKFCAYHVLAQKCKREHFHEKMDGSLAPSPPIHLLFFETRAVKYRLYSRWTR
jgi:hypothetical protein